MSIAEKLVTIAENEQRVYEAGRLKTLRDSEYMNAKVSGTAIAVNDVNAVEHSVGCYLTSDTITDFSGIEVTRYGKNFLNDAKRTKPAYGNVYFGTETAKGSFPLPAGTYTFSVEIAPNFTPNVFVYKKDGTEIAKAYIKSYVSFTLIEKTDVIVKVLNNNLTSEEDVYTAQIELGSVATSYEQYVKPTTHRANADGMVDDITSVSPNMTLISNTGAVVINANYLRDIDTYIDNLKTNVALTGGE